MASSRRRWRRGRSSSLTASVTSCFSAAAPRPPSSSAISTGFRAVHSAAMSSRLGDLGTAVGVVGDGALAVGLRPTQECGRPILGVAESDGVAAALAHLGSVGAEEHGSGGEQRVGLAEDRRAGAVALVEPPGDQPRGLHVRQLISPDRHQVAVAEQNVGGLVDRVGEQQCAQAATAAGRRLGLDRWVATQLGVRDQAEERKQQLVERRHGAVREDRRAGRIDPGGEVVQDKPVDGIGEVADAVAVGDHLVVGDHEEDLDAGPLEAHPVGECAEVVAQMQRAGGPVAGQDAEALGVLSNPFLERPAAGGGAIG